MIRVTKQQRANAIEARDVMWPSVPPENVMRNLAKWRLDRGRPDCGTVACFGGWCAWWPAFRIQGVVADEYSMPRMGVRLAGTDVARRLFGDKTLFYPSGHSFSDSLAPKGCTDHELVTHRLNWLIMNSEVIE